MTAPNTFKMPVEQAFAGISVPWVSLFLKWVAIATIPLSTITFIRNIYYQATVGILVLIWFAFFFKYFSTYDDYIKNRLKFKYIIDDWYELHGIYRCSTDLDRLLTYIPIVGVYLHGVIEFVGNRYGLLYTYYAPDVEDNETALQEHVEELKPFLHTIPAGMLVRFKLCARYAYNSPALQKLQERMNKSKLPPSLFRLLKSLYEKIKNKQNQAPDHTFYIFFAFPEHVDTLDKAQDYIKKEMRGLEQGMTDARMQATRIENRKQVILEYMNFFRPLGVLRDVLL